jgi:guanidinobutyrase / D-arginase
MREDNSGPIGPVDGRQVPRFAGSGSFARIPEIDRVPDYDVAVLGVPFDSGTSYRPGARFGRWPSGRPHGTSGPAITWS